MALDLDISKILGGDMQNLIKQMQSAQQQHKEHVTICDLMFKKKDVSYSEPIVQEITKGEHTVKVTHTKVYWETNREPIIFPISPAQFNEEFNK